MLNGSMTMYLHSLNCPTRVVGGVNKNRTHLKTWCSSPIFSAKPLSILLQTDVDDNLSDSRDSDLGSQPMGAGTPNPILSQANTVGIIGASAVSTLNFLEKLIGWSSKDGKESLPFIICSDPVLKRELSSLERSSFHLLRSRNSCFQFDHTLIVEDLRHKKAFLERSGARCIVMPCHISHAWHDEISDSCSVPFLHVGECVAKELKEANLKPVEAGSNVRIGVLATNAKLTAGYQEKLLNQGFEVILPDKDTMEHTVIPAIEALHRKDIEGARNLLRISLQVLLVRAATYIILASDDMHGLLPPDDPLLKKCIDPMDALVRSTIQWAQSTEERDDT